MTNDLISRQAAINSPVKMIAQGLDWVLVYHLEQLPSAERRVRWIPDFNGKFKGGAYRFRCSMCGRIVPNVRNGGWNYCPNCGADMRGEQNDQ